MGRGTVPPAVPSGEVDQPEAGPGPGEVPVEPGPLTLPADRRDRDPRWAWLVAAGVILLGLILFALTRPPGPALGRPVPPPSWGPLTLRRVALDAARAAGDAHPRQAFWVSTRKGDALALLTGQPSDSPEAVYLVLLRGHFRQGGEGWLAGSLPAGPHLVVLVRGFDGLVVGRGIVGDPPPDLARLGIVRPLPLGLARLL
jgi:hypothetical protein